MRTRIAAVVLLSLLGAAWSHAQSRAVPAFKQENNSPNFKALMEMILQQAQKAPAEGAALLESMVPGESRIRAALRPDVTQATVQKLLAYYKELAAREKAQPEPIARPEQTVVRISGATTEEIVASSTVASLRFPGGAKAMAQKVLRPGIMFYEAEFLEPSKDLGVKYHLFYWDGRQWTMLGAIWRVLQ
jgi:hypothetical protein